MSSGIGTTGVMKFNVRDRDRRYRGEDRNFDTVALAQVINSPAVQERVAKGDLFGFYSHWPRLKFGMEPMEGGVLNGKVVNLEPAIRTKYLKAYDDGTIEHEEEFLDTVPGRLSHRLHQTKAGGFSSAIVAPKRGAMNVAKSFHGFDYVLEPNYSTNRGYMLDGVPMDDREAAIFDEVAQYNELMDSTNALFDQVQKDFDNLEEVAHRLELENVQLRSMLARYNRNVPGEIALDGVLDVVAHPKTSIFDNADDFRDAELAGYEEPKQEAPKQPDSAADKHLKRRFGF